MGLLIPPFVAVAIPSPLATSLPTAALPQLLLFASPSLPALPPLITSAIDVRPLGIRWNRL